MRLYQNCYILWIRMNPNTQKKLLEINQNFYDTFASSFSDTRHQVQPGVRKLVERMITSDSILDVGCGNGTLARILSARSYRGSYLGVDMSKELLVNAKKLLENPSQGDFHFHVIDLSKNEWHQALPVKSFDWLVSFAVLHHIPGKKLRQDIVRSFASLTSKESYVALSVWQWQNSPRLSKRILPWSTVGLTEEAVDEGDVLLDWRARETIGLRYVHTFNEAELAALAEQAGFTVVENFYADGKSGDLALYQIWKLK